MNAQVSPALAGTNALRSADASGRQERLFWIFQLLFWPGYGVVLMLPWIGTYTIASMIPNKIGVAVTGVVVGLLMRRVLGRASAVRSGRGTLVAVLIVVMAIVVAGFLWHLSLELLLRRSIDFDVRHFGAAIAGIPQLAGAFYHVLVLTVWTLGWLLIRGALVKPSAAAVDAPLPIAVNAAPERLVIQDGPKTIMLGPREIDWIQAEGDYVRIHTGARSLLIRATLGGTYARLPSADYLRIHRSAIVRVGQVREVRARSNNELDVVLRDGTRLRASRSYSDSLKSALGIHEASADRPVD
jgi:hypothetical protein